MPRFSRRSSAEASADPELIILQGFSTPMVLSLSMNSDTLSLIQVQNAIQNAILRSQCDDFIGNSIYNSDY